MAGLRDSRQVSRSCSELCICHALLERFHWSLTFVNNLTLKIELKLSLVKIESRVFRPQESQMGSIMTTIGSSTNYLGNLVQASSSSTTSRAIGVDQDGDGDGSSGTGRSRGSKGGGQVLAAIKQTLSQLGLGQAGQITSTPATTATSSSTANNDTNSSASSNGQNVSQALHAFMHSLFQALSSDGSSQQTSTATDADGDKDASQRGSKAVSGYGDLTSRLQGLVQSLNGSGNSTSTSATSDLSASFQNLVKALSSSTASGTTDTATSSTSPDLQKFLSTLVQNLQNNSGLSSTGNLINTQAA